METTFDFSIVPHQYSLCLNTECPQSNSCLRQLSERNVPDSVTYWNIISPKYLATCQGNCPYYRSNKKVIYAKGFVNMLDSLPHKQMQTVINLLMSYFSRRTYYRMRKGERPLSPSEQQSVLKIIKNGGITTPLQFDSYYEDFEW